MNSRNAAGVRLKSDQRRQSNVPKSGDLEDILIGRGPGHRETASSLADSNGLHTVEVLKNVSCASAKDERAEMGTYRTDGPFSAFPSNPQT